MDRIILKWYKGLINKRYTQNAENGLMSVPKVLLKNEHLGDMARVLTMGIAFLRGQTKLLPNLPLSFSYLLQPNSYRLMLPRMMCRYLQIKQALKVLSTQQNMFTMRRRIRPNQNQKKIFAASYRLRRSCQRFKDRILAKNGVEIVLFEMNLNDLQTQSKNFIEKRPDLTREMELDNGMHNVNPTRLRNNLRTRRVLKMRQWNDVE